MSDRIWAIIIGVALIAGFVWIYKESAAKRSAQGDQTQNMPTLRQTLRGADRHQTLMRWYGKHEH